MSKECKSDSNKNKIYRILYTLTILVQKSQYVIMYCIHRWAPDCADSLPEYMKTIFKFAWNVMKECESEGISEEGLSFNVQGLLEEVMYESTTTIQWTILQVDIIVDIKILFCTPIK